MSDEPSIVFKFDGGDPAIQNAYAKARDTFRYFYREVHWEARRIIKFLSVACVKAPFADPEPNPEPDGNPEVEHMWINDIEFDGRTISGKLVNQPNWLKSFNEGDDVKVALGDISDWMYVVGGEVYGAFTVNLMRQGMDDAERRRHDQAWGLDFGDPNVVKLVAPEERKKPGLLKRLFGSKPAPRADVIGEHPMSVNAAPMYRKQLAGEPEIVTQTFDRGWTLLHQDALAGSAPTVAVMLEFGADPNAVGDDGTTPLQLAESLRWEKVVALLKQAGAR